MLSWLSSILCQVGQLASSKSAIQQLAPELSAFMVILRSGGPVSSTRLSCRSSGIGAIFQSPSLTSLVSGRKSGISPALIFSCRSARLPRSSTTVSLYSRESFATKATASGVSISSNSSGISAVNSTPSAYVRVPSVMTSGSSLQLPERGYSSKPRPGTLGAGPTQQVEPPYDVPWEPCARTRCRRSARNATGKEPETPQTLSAPASQWQARPLRNDAPESPPSAGPCTVPESYFHLSSLHRESKIPTPQILFQLFAHITYIGENYTCEPYKLNATAGSVADKALQAPC